MAQLTHRRGRQKTWTEDDKELQTLYGVSSMNPEASRPKFGPGIQLLLTSDGFARRISQQPGDIAVTRISDEDDMQLMAPTLLNLAWHFRYMRWARINMNKIVRKSKGDIIESDIDKRFFLAAQDKAKKDFEMQRAKPLRAELLKQEYPLYFYCVNQVLMQTDETTGVPFTFHGEEVLCILPKTIRAAEYYGLSEQEMCLFAPCILHLVKNLCALHAIKTPDEFKNAIAGWIDIVDDPCMTKYILESVATMNPYLRIA